jgi:hypothetical protein
MDVAHPKKGRAALDCRIHQEQNAFPMLTISSSQMARLGDLSQARFVDECARALRARHPAETQGESQDELLARVQALVDKLCGFGFLCTGDLAHAIELIVDFQYAPGKPAMPAAVAAQLRSPHVSVDKKIEALEQLFLFAAA